MSTATRPNLFFRNDTLFGVCEALGEDFAINPAWFRIAFAAPLIISPLAVIAAYFATGAVVIATRLFFPNPRRAAGAAAAPRGLPAEAPARDDEMAIAA